MKVCLKTFDGYGEHEYEIEMSDTAVLGCCHGRLEGQMCPHCLGVSYKPGEPSNVAATLTTTYGPYLVVPGEVTVRPV